MKFKFKKISMWGIRWCFVTFCLFSVDRQCWGSQEILTKITKGFGVALEECKKEQNTGEHVMQDFFNFWREDYDLVNREFGCMVLCMGQKLGLVDPDMKMHHGNAQDFAQKHGADEEIAKKLVALVHECEKTHEAIDEHCARVLETAKCFRTKIHELKWAPSMSVVMEEMLNAL